MIRRAFRHVSAAAALLLALLVAPLAAQSDDGSFGTAVGGAALGAYAGLFLGDFIGDLVSCDACPAFYLGGAVAGGGLGAYAGATNSQRVKHGLIGAGICAVAGALLAEVLERSGVTQSDTGPRWLEGALAGGALGALIGMVLPAETSAYDPMRPQGSIIAFRLRF